MPGGRYTTQLAASATKANILEGTNYLYAPFDGMVRVWGVQDNADPNALLMDVIFGNVMHRDGWPIQDFGAGLGPSRRDHVVMAERCRRGDPLVIRLRNTDSVNASNPRIEYDFIFRGAR